MPAVNFFPRFADQVASGQKRQSIRLRQFHPGAKLYLFTGLRTRSARCLAVGTVTRSRNVVIDYVGYAPSIKLDGVTLSEKEAESFSRADGFPDLDSLMDFFSDHYDLPLQAWVTEWDPVTKTEGAAA